MACEEHADGGVYLSTDTVREWQADMREELGRYSTHSDYGILSKDMWIELQVRMDCDTCGFPLDGKVNKPVEPRTLFYVRGESLEGITYHMEIRADSEWDAEGELAQIMEYDGLRPGSITATVMKDTPLPVE